MPNKDHAWSPLERNSHSRDKIPIEIIILSWESFLISANGNCAGAPKYRLPHENHRADRALK